MVESFVQAHLDNLRYHWGDVYAISHPEPDVWLAQRRDNGKSMRADDPDALRALIRVDAAESPFRRPGGPS